MTEQQQLAELERSLETIAVRMEYVKLMGTLYGGTLLSQIAYWTRPGAKGQSKLKVFRQGVWWIAKTREQWMAECGITITEYKRAIKKLVELGVVEVKVMKFAGVAQTHLRLLVVQLIAKLDEARPALDGASQTTRLASDRPSGWAAADHSYTETTTETTDREKADATGVAVKVPVVGVTQQVPAVPRAIEDWMAERPVLAEQKAGRFTAREWLMKAQDILKHCQTQMGLREVRLTTNSLAMAWKRGVADKYGTFVKELTHKEIGQLKMFLQKVGDKAPEVMAAAIDQWGDFVLETKYQKGLSATPERPVLGFLLQHYDVAMQLIAKPLVQPSPEFDKPEVPQQTAVHETPKDVATLEDVMNALAEYGTGK